MATITRYVDPDAAAGGDGTTTALTGANCAYVSLSVWEAARQGDLAAAGNIEQAVCQSTHASHTADTTALVIDGSTTSDSCYMEITVASGSRHAGVWSASKYRITYTSASGYRRTVVVADPNVVIDGLQVGGDGTATEHIGLYNNAGTNDGVVTIKNCITDVALSSGSAIGIYCAWDTLIFNCIVPRCTGTSGSGIYIGGNNSGTSHAYNCTISNCTSYGINRGGNHTAYATNCAVFNTPNDFNGTITIDYCASDDGDGTHAVNISPGATEADDWAKAFTDYANGDFSIKDTDSVLYDAGTDLSGTFTTDIKGTTRSTWDIGAFEYVAAGGGGGASIIPRIAYYNRLLRGHA